MGETPACITCPALRPDAEPRQPHQPPVCDGDRRLIDRHLGEIANLNADLVNEEPAIVDDRQYERFGVEYLRKGHGARKVVSLGVVYADPLANYGGVAPINGRPTAPRTSGSREAPIPIRVDELDLKALAKVPNPTDAARDRPDDQIGHLSVATTLDQWVRDIRDTLFPDHHLPPAAVDEMVMWLRRRLEVICDRHPAVDEFAREIRDLRGRLRGATGQTEPPPEPCDGVTCARCNLRALFRRPGDTYRAECSSCGTLYTEDEYAALTEAQAKTERSQRRPEDIASLLRHN